MDFETHPLLHKSKKCCLVVRGSRCVVRRVRGKHVSEERALDEKIEVAAREALMGYGVRA